jgi:hypothetical protein
MERFESRSPASFADIVSCIGEEFGFQLLVDSVRHYPVKLPGFPLLIGIPMDAHHLACNLSKIDQHSILLKIFQQLSSSTARKPGIKNGLILIPGRLLSRSLLESSWSEYQRRDRNRATLLAAPTVDGMHSKPLIIINWETCEAERFQIGYKQDTVLYASQEDRFITLEPLPWWVSEILYFLPGYHNNTSNASVCGTCSGYFGWLRMPWK